jgi:hypothetical protein
MDTCDALFENRRIPRQVHIDQRRGVLQIEPSATGIGRQEDAAVGIVAEALDQRGSLSRRYAAVETDITQPASLRQLPSSHDGPS